MDDYDIDKARRCQNPPGFLRITETEEWRSRRNRHIQVAVLLNGIENDAESTGSLRYIPDGECDSTALPQHAMGLLDGSLRPGKMEHSEIQHHCVEAGVGERQILGVTLTKIDGGMAAACLFHHLGRKIDSGCNGASCRCRGGDVSRTA